MREHLSKEEIELVGPTHNLYISLMRIQEEYFDACEDLKYNPYDRPLELFFLVMGRATAATAEDIIADAQDKTTEFPGRDEMISHFIATIHDGTKIKGSYAGGHTIQ